MEIAVFVEVVEAVNDAVNVEEDCYLICGVVIHYFSIGRPRGVWRFGMCCGSRTGRKEDMEAGRKVNLLQPTKKGDNMVLLPP